MSDAVTVSDRIVIHPDPVLRVRCAEVEAANLDVIDLGKRLETAMMEANGIGLAAPQIGVSKRVIVVGIKGSSRIIPIIMNNPEITWQSSKLTPMPEGCLSIPGKRFVVQRPDAVKIRYYDCHGVEVVTKLIGLTAKCVQHEIDHLDGVLILDKGEEWIPPLAPDV